MQTSLGLLIPQAPDLKSHTLLLSLLLHNHSQHNYQKQREEESLELAYEHYSNVIK